MATQFILLVQLKEVLVFPISWGKKSFLRSQTPHIFVEFISAFVNVFDTIRRYWLARIVRLRMIFGVKVLY